MEIVGRLNKALDEIDDKYIGYAKAEGDFIKVIYASKINTDLSAEGREHQLNLTLIENGIYDLHMYNISYFIMSEEEYRESVSSPTFNGI